MSVDVMERHNRTQEGTDRPNPRWTENGLRVLRARYLKKDEQGRLQETPRSSFVASPGRSRT